MLKGSVKRFALEIVVVNLICFFMVWMYILKNSMIVPKNVKKSDMKQLLPMERLKTTKRTFPREIAGYNFAQFGQTNETEYHHKMKAMVGKQLLSEFTTLKTEQCDWFRIRWDEQQGMWVDFKKEDLVIYYFRQAYLDIRMEFRHVKLKYIRFFAMFATVLLTNNSIYCQLPSLNSSVPAEVEELFFPMWNTQFRGFRAFMLSCPVPLWANPTPKNVGIGFGPCAKAIQLPVQTNGAERSLKKKEVREKNFVLCVKPLLFTMDMSERIIEWIEMQRIFGATKIVFYVYKVHENIQRVLNYYRELGFIETISWTLPFVPHDQILEYLSKRLWQKRRSEVLTYHHCFYEHFYDFKFVLPIDVDEFIIPLASRSWVGMMNSVIEDDPDIYYRVGGYAVYNAIFYPPKTHEIGYLPKSGLRILKWLTRARQFNKPGHNVKTFHNTLTVRTLFNHYPKSMLYYHMKRIIMIPRDQAQMNHYKDTCLEETYYCKVEKMATSIVNDTQALRFKDELLRRYNSAVKHIWLMKSRNTT